MKTTSLNTYPDQLISETWVNWSESALNKKHDDGYSSPTGFQDFLGANTSDPRTRSGELFSVGLLRGLLVNSRGGSRTDLPFGWDLIQSDENVHTRIGYFSYAIGKAIQQKIQNTHIDKALSILCTIFLLQTGFKYKDQYLLTSSLFDYVYDKFKPTKRITNPIKWHRYLAAALFCTLHNDSLCSNLLDLYLNQAAINDLYIIDKNSKTLVTADDLLHMLDQNASISNVSPPKNSLYWIGNPNDVAPRGIYTIAIKEGRQLLKLVDRLEWSNFSNGIESPFKPLIEKDSDITGQCVIEELSSIFHNDQNLKNEWERCMDTLSKGVTESLRFINEEYKLKNKRVFYVHDPDDAENEDDDLILDIGEELCTDIPVSNDIIILNNQKYSVRDVDKTQNRVKITIEKI